MKVVNGHGQQEMLYCPLTLCPIRLEEQYNVGNTLIRFLAKMRRSIPLQYLSIKYEAGPSRQLAQLGI